MSYFGIIGTTHEQASGKFLECEVYDDSVCQSDTEEKCFTRENCSIPLRSLRNKNYYCYTTWDYDEDRKRAKVQMKGCSRKCRGGNNYCEELRKDEAHIVYRCCCNTNMCNTNLTFLDYNFEPTRFTATAKPPHIEGKEILSVRHGVVIVLLSFSAFLFMMLCIYFIVYRGEIGCNPFSSRESSRRQSRDQSNYVVTYNPSNQQEEHADEAAARITVQNP